MVVRKKIAKLKDLNRIMKFAEVKIENSLKYKGLDKIYI